MRRKMGVRAFAGLYRLLYNLFSVVTFVPVLYLLATRVPSSRLWVVPVPYNLVFNLLQLVGLVGLALSLWQTDVWDFAGLRPAVAYLRGTAEPQSSPRLVTGGLYAYVRHPLYFFSLLIIWFNPVVTLNGLVFNLMATLYFWIGSIYEERKLVAAFGHAYARYQQRVPRLIPFWPW